MRAFNLALAALIAATLPVRSQPLPKGECDEFVSGITEISRAAAGMLIHVENMNTGTLKSGSDKVAEPVKHLDEARKLLIVVRVHPRGQGSRTGGQRGDVSSLTGGVVQVDIGA